ncbi:hypothetical protein MMC20_001768 [Loxospora ochrophaea]|nr:hypothetical protein [Loxospora ochrophaea]
MSHADPPPAYSLTQMADVEAQASLSLSTALRVLWDKLYHPRAYTYCVNICTGFVLAILLVITPQNPQIGTKLLHLTAFCFYILSLLALGALEDNSTWAFSEESRRVKRSVDLVLALVIFYVAIATLVCRIIES